MARIIKGNDLQRERIATYARESLEEFPDHPIEAIIPDEEIEEAIPEPTAEELKEAILEDARGEAARKITEAYAEGHRRGMEAGRTEFDASLSEVRQTLIAASTALQDVREEFLASLEPQVITLVTQIARRILDEELRTGGQRIEASVRRALSKIADHQKVIVRVHPDDLEAMREHKLTLLEDFDGLRDIRLEASETVAPGGCVAVTDTLEVDARWETLFNNLLEDMLE